MQTEGVKTKIYAGVVTTLLLTALTGTGMLYDMRSDLQVSLDNERLNGEKLLSEKLMLDKEIIALKNNISELSGKNDELNNQLIAANSKVAQQQTTVNKLQKDNSNLKGLKKEVVQKHYAALGASLQTKR
jgi:chromosome segregation ATPase